MKPEYVLKMLLDGKVVNPEHPEISSALNELWRRGYVEHIPRVGTVNQFRVTSEGHSYYASSKKTNWRKVSAIIAILSFVATLFLAIIGFILKKV